jgi:hypothetical protein
MADPIPIPLAGFEGRGLALQPAGLWKGAVIVCDGVPAPRQGRTFTLKDNAGAPVTLKFAGAFFDPLPGIQTGGQTIRLVPAFAWWEYALIVLPILLVAVGGALGGGLGAGAAYANAQILRLRQPLGVRIMLCLVSAAAAFLLWLGVGILIYLAGHSH